MMDNISLVNTIVDSCLIRHLFVYLCYGEE